MHWIAPTDKDNSGPILGLIFLRSAEVRFSLQCVNLQGASAFSRRGSRVDEPAVYHAEASRFRQWRKCPERIKVGIS